MRQRITLTLPEEVISESKLLSRGNLSQFVTEALREHLADLRRQRLRAALEAGYRSEAELDLAICEEFRYSDQENAAGC